MMQTPGKFVAAMRVDRLKQPAHDPYIHCQNMQITSDGAPQDRSSDCAETKNHDFDWGGVFGRHAKRRGVLVVDLVDVLVKRAPVKCSVRPIVPGILHHEEDTNLVCHCEEGWEGYSRGESKELGHWMEKPWKSQSRLSINQLLLVDQ